MKIQFSRILISFSLVFIALPCSALTLSGHDVSLWVPATLVPQVEQKINSEQPRPGARLQLNGINFGYQYAGLNPVREACLIEVYNLLTQTSVKPNVAYIGRDHPGPEGPGASMSGRGLHPAPPSAGVPPRPEGRGFPLLDETKMAWKLRTAGAQLNLFDLDADIEPTPTYDVVWVDEPLHLKSPDQLMRMILVIQNLLKPGGKVYLEGQTVYQFQRIRFDRGVTELVNTDLILDAFENALQDNQPFPGYLAIDMGLLIEPVSRTILEIHLLSALSIGTLNNAPLPQYSQVGVFNPSLSKEKRDQLEKIKSRRKTCISEGFVCPMAVGTNYYHQIIHFMDFQTLSTLFQSHGFEVVGSYKFNTLPSPIMTSITADELGVIFKKPQ